MIDGPLKRARVTRSIAHYPIPQFQLENPETTTFVNVPDSDVASKIRLYLEASKELIQTSDNYFDELIPVAIEHNGSVKMLHFGLSTKQFSCFKKRFKFQEEWWKNKNGHEILPNPTEPVYLITEDTALYQNHFLMPENGNSHMQKIQEELRSRLTTRRTEDDVILDSSYFVREFFLTKSIINLRVSRSSDIPELFAPPTLEGGYFPFSATTIGNQMDYLSSRYQEAQMEYLNINFRSIEPSEGFRVGRIYSKELYEFHQMGRHIHGFFLCWESKTQTRINERRKKVPRRYLVDMFFQLKFPIDVDYERWDSRLKLAFDQTTVYLLHLTEIIRINRPVFDKLSLNLESLFQKLTFEEIRNSMNEQGTNIVEFCDSVGAPQLYQTGNRLANESYLSAFFIICGGTKILRPIEHYDLGTCRVYKDVEDRLCYLNEKGEVMEAKKGVVPSRVLVCSRDDFSISEETVSKEPIPAAAKNITRLICDMPKENSTGSATTS
ncbi:unnamed protein product [Caenorhabditis brenneri]